MRKSPVHAAPREIEALEYIASRNEKRIYPTAKELSKELSLMMSIASSTANSYVRILQIRDLVELNAIGLSCTKLAHYFLANRQIKSEEAELREWIDAETRALWDPETSWYDKESACRRITGQDGRLAFPKCFLDRLREKFALSVLPPALPADFLDLGL